MKIFTILNKQPQLDRTSATIQNYHHMSAYGHKRGLLLNEKDRGLVQDNLYLKTRTPKKLKERELNVFKYFKRD